MDKSTDSSDSDSSLSTSWVFVDDAATINQNSANTFHLDCSREPIQELTEQDLLSAGSDLESDTDGISVISESEIPVDESYTNIQSTSCPASNETPETKETNNENEEFAEINYDGDVEELQSESLMVLEEENGRFNVITELVKRMKPLHLLGVGFVLIAVCVASYNQIMTKMSEKDFENKDDVALYDKVDLTSNNNLGKLCDNKWEKELVQNKLTGGKQLYKIKPKNKKSLNRKSSFKDENVEKIIDITVSCAFHEKPKNDLVNRAIKECATKEYQRQKDRSGKDDEFLWTPEKKKIKYMYKYKELEDNDKAHTENEFEIEAQYQEYLKGQEKTNSKRKGEEPGEEEYKKYKKRIEESNKDESIKNSKMKEKYKSKRDKYPSGENTNKRYQRDIKYLRPLKPKYEKKVNNYNTKLLQKKGQKYNMDYKNKKHEIVNDYDSELDNRGNKFSKLHKKLSNLKKKFKSQEKFINNSEKVENTKYENKLNRRYLKQNNSGGEWYINLHKARDQIRKQEHVSDWVFDRAYMRTKRRNKAQWYFKWMNVREQLRYKRSYKPYSS